MADAAANKRQIHPRRVSRRALAVIGGATAVAALAQLGREATLERRGELAPTYAATHVAQPSPPGRLAAAVARPAPLEPPRGWRAVLARAWAAPTTAVGVVLAVLSLGRWSWDAEHGTWLVRGARSPFLALGGFQANAVGHVIVARPQQPAARLLVHEAAHVRQAERLGPFTLPLYVWWLARHGYRSHPMERGARATTRRWLRNDDRAR